MNVYFERADGTFWVIRADSLDAARAIVANEMVAVKESSSAEENADLFPIYWCIKNASEEIVASGHIEASDASVMSKDEFVKCYCCLCSCIDCPQTTESVENCYKEIIQKKRGN